MSSNSEEFDAIIIGAGQAGVPLAKSFAGAGKKTALIERLHVGGTCINEGCTPTKTMVASAKVAYLGRRALEFGVKSGLNTVDMERVRQRKRDVVEAFVSSMMESIKSTKNLELISGHAHFVGPKAVDVLVPEGEFRSIHAETIVINTGGRPNMPPIPGLDTIPALDSTSIMELGELPGHLLILGGSYIACEFGQMFRRFGSRVTIVERAPILLNKEDRDISKAVTDILREDGIRVLLGSEATSIEKGITSIRVTINSQGMELPIECTHVLVALGRVPNTDGLDLESSGVETDERGYIRVNDKLETNVPGIYAAGDVNGGPAFTHISYDDYRILKANLLSGGDLSRAGRMLPYTVFIDPQLGRVGIGADEAKRQGLDIKVATLQMEHVARAYEMSETRGFMKAVVDANTNQILGCAVLGIEGGELMAMIEITMLGKVPYTTLRDAVFAHPTLAESFNNLFAYLD